MEHKPLRWRLIAFGALVGIGFAGNVLQCVSLIGETEGVLVITVTTTVGTVAGIGVLGYRSIRSTGGRPSERGGAILEGHDLSPDPPPYALPHRPRHVGLG